LRETKALIRFGIAGFGLHAKKRLMPGFGLAKHSRVSALSHRDPDHAKQLAREYGIPLAFASVEEMSQSSEVDAVLVTSPNSCHLQDVLSAVRQGKPVLCEKPMAMNAAECRRMVEAARQAKICLGVAQVFRFEESTARLRERVAAGQIGTPVLVRSEFSFQAGVEHARKWIYNRAVAGGGPIADVGVHCIDALRFILQDEVVRVSARAARDKHSGDVEASAALTLEFSGETLGAVLVSYRGEYRTPLDLVGDAGVLRANDALNVDHPAAIELVRGGKVVESETVSNRLAYAKQVDAFAEAVEGKADFPVPGEQGWQNQEILDAAYRSVESGRVEAVPPVFS
jgi:predicted dehydrogenase